MGNRKRMYFFGLNMHKTKTAFERDWLTDGQFFLQIASCGKTDEEAYCAKSFSVTISSTCAFGEGIHWNNSHLYGSAAA